MRSSGQVLLLGARRGLFRFGLCFFLHSALLQRWRGLSGVLCLLHLFGKDWVMIPRGIYNTGWDWRLGMGTDRYLFTLPEIWRWIGSWRL